MTTTERYQGWANYETWAVKLHLDNEEGPYRYWAARTLELQNPDAVTYKNPYMTEDRRRVHQLADELQEAHEAELPEVTGFAADLLTSAFGAVDWREIAESLLADATTR